MIGRVLGGSAFGAISALLLAIPSVTVTVTPATVHTGDTVTVQAIARDVLGRTQAHPAVTFAYERGLVPVSPVSGGAPVVQRALVQSVDSARVIATWARSDGVKVADTLWLHVAAVVPVPHADTITVHDTIRVRDTLYLPPPVDTTRPPLPPGTYAGMLCDSLPVVQTTASGRFFLLHTMDARTAGRPDTVFVQPDTLAAALGRPMPWVAVAIAPVGGIPQRTTARLRIAYLPGDTEVLRSACYNAPAIVFRWLSVVPG